LQSKKHPDTTCIGRASKGFDVPDFNLAAHGGIAAAGATIRRHLERIGRLSEPGVPMDRTRHFVRRWRGWAGPFLRISQRSASMDDTPADSFLLGDMV